MLRAKTVADNATVERPSRSARRVTKLETALSGLGALDLAALRARWHALTNRAAPATVRAPLLRAAVAYTLQGRALGGLKASTARLLHRVADPADPSRRDQNTDPLQPGMAASGPATLPPTTLPPTNAQNSNRRGRMRLDFAVAASVDRLVLDSQNWRAPGQAPGRAGQRGSGWWQRRSGLSSTGAPA